MKKINDFLLGVALCASLFILSIFTKYRFYTLILSFVAISILKLIFSPKSLKFSASDKRSTLFFWTLLPVALDEIFLFLKLDLALSLGISVMYVSLITIAVIYHRKSQKSGSHPIK